MAPTTDQNLKHALGAVLLLDLVVATLALSSPPPVRTLLLETKALTTVIETSRSAGLSPLRWVSDWEGYLADLRGELLGRQVLNPHGAASVVVDLPSPDSPIGQSVEALSEWRGVVVRIRHVQTASAIQEAADKLAAELDNVWLDGCAAGTLGPLPSPPSEAFRELPGPRVEPLVFEGSVSFELRCKGQVADMAGDGFEAVWYRTVELPTEFEAWPTAGVAVDLQRYPTVAEHWAEVRNMTPRELREWGELRSPTSTKTVSMLGVPIPLRLAGYAGATVTAVLLMFVLAWVRDPRRWAEPDAGTSFLNSVSDNYLSQYLLFTFIAVTPSLACGALIFRFNLQPVIASAVGLGLFTIGAVTYGAVLEWVRSRPIAAAGA